MRANRLILAGASISAVVAIVLASARVHAQRLGARRGSAQVRASTSVAQSQPKLAQPKLPKSRAADFVNDPGAPVFPVYVDSDLVLDQNAQALYQQIATALSGYAAVPNARTNYYSALDNNPAFVFSSWTATISNVQTVAGGNVVTVGVYPVFSNRATVLTPCDYAEQYLVGNDGSITYQGSADPNGYAGQMPAANDL